ncbi:MAG TPA: hypothetical protein VGN46_20015 [Luteibacter sp.]|jgi:GTPase involved in cell partitioning and DNA repair|uniref:hypothetical protein n=1 Tax=Luteibacter sp. TaxID=1886636 RepID=UPI002F3F3DC2
MLFERELANFDADLVERPRWLVINKMDVFDDEEELEAVANDIVARLGWTSPSFLVSAAGQQGTREVCLQVHSSLMPSALRASSTRKSSTTCACAPNNPTVVGNTKKPARAGFFVSVMAPHHSLGLA